MTNRCPFCGNYAYAAPVGDAYRMDCRYCEIQVEITKRAYAARCPNPVAVLEYIREKMKGSIRPRVDLVDMKRQRPALTIEDEEMTIQTKPPESDSDLLTTAAKAIGSTLGKIAVQAGIVKPPAGTTKVRRKTAAKKPKTASKRSPAKAARRVKDKKRK